MTENELVPCQFRINEKAFYKLNCLIVSHICLHKQKVCQSCVTFISASIWKFLSAVSVTDLDSISLSFLGWFLTMIFTSIAAPG